MTRFVLWVVSIGVALASAGASIAAYKEGLERAVQLWLSYAWLPLAGKGLAGVVGAAVFLMGLDAALSFQRRRVHQLKPAGEGSLAEILDETHFRITKLLRDREPDVVSILDEMLIGAAAANASDVHITPETSACRVTLRVDGTLYPLVEIGALEGRSIVNRIKVLSRLRLEQRQQPQDGRMTRVLNDLTLDIRVSTLPTDSGERVVLRLVSGAIELPRISELGLDASISSGLLGLLARPQGVLFVTGPVGSGKSTTLYASLKHIFETRGTNTSLVTLEDPIEHRLEFLTQTQVSPHTGLTFAQTLRSVLRQDPNVLMVGEIRDGETAEIAVQAGLTGHLILTTVHANDAAGAFTRLIDMGVDPMSLSSASVGSLSQRLVRSLCTACRRVQRPDATVAARLRRLGATLPDATYYAEVGCPLCDHQGYHGRVPIAELVIVDAQVRKAINARAEPDEIRRLAEQSGMPNLIQAGVRLAARGETTLSEVLRVAG